ncbi:unnamed protein product, partial [Laminaria digitata]
MVELSSRHSIRCEWTATALHVAGKPNCSSRTKHVALRLFFLRQLFNSGKTAIHRLETQATLADCATAVL